MVVFSQPSAARSTILARRTRRAGVRRPLDHCQEDLPFFIGQREGSGHAWHAWH